MSRYRRNHDGRIYFFTVVTANRQPILTSDLGRRCLREAIEETWHDHPFTTIAFVLLPDHLHLIWELPARDVDYSTRWKKIKSRFTRRWVASDGAETDVPPTQGIEGRRGVWQRRFWEHTCQDAKDLKRCCDYVHVNPLKHGYVEHVVDWPWSSFHRFVREGEYEPSWGNAEWFGDEFDRFE